MQRQSSSPTPTPNASSERVTLHRTLDRSLANLIPPLNTACSRVIEHRIESEHNCFSCHVLARGWVLVWSVAMCNTLNHPSGLANLFTRCKGIMVVLRESASPSERIRSGPIWPYYKLKPIWKQKLLHLVNRYDKMIRKREGKMSWHDMHRYRGR